MADILDIDVDDWHFVLGTIILLQNPLSITDISHLLGFTRAHVAGLLTGLHSVLAMPPSHDNHGVIRTIHASFHDYLTDEKRCLDPKIVVRPTVHHGKIGLCLFKYMAQSLKRNICDIDRIKFNREVVDLADRRKKYIDGSLVYACRYWAYHLAHASLDEHETDQLVTALDDFIRHRLLYWIETLSLLENMGVSVAALRTAISWHSVSLSYVVWNVFTYVYLFYSQRVSRPRSELAGLLVDGYRTVLEFFDAIRDSAPHIYISALSLMPKKRPLKDVYRHVLYWDHQGTAWDRIQVEPLFAND